MKLLLLALLASAALSSCSYLADSGPHYSRDDDIGIRVSSTMPEILPPTAQ